MYLKQLKIRNHPILKDIDFDFINPNTGEPYSIIAFVGENGCGKTTLLNEIFNYSKSEYVVDKQTNNSPFHNTGMFFSTFLRQGQLYHSSMDHIMKLLNGEAAVYPEESPEIKDLRKKPNTIYYSYEARNVSLFEDDEINKIFRDRVGDKFIPGSRVSKVIDGKTGEDDYEKYSSGQQELIFKIQTIASMQSITDFLLLDEPETSLHPRWQKIIIDYVLEQFTMVGEDYRPQIFLATHSEKILESIINRPNTLIIRLFKNEDNVINKETIPQMDLVLPKPTFAELDYVIFKIDSFEYCSELYDLLEWKSNKHMATKIDKIIKASEHYDESVHKKEWINELNGDKTESSPVYCRNYFHHPKDRQEPTSEELHCAIELLRKVILNLEQK